MRQIAAKLKSTEITRERPKAHNGPSNARPWLFPKDLRSATWLTFKIFTNAVCYVCELMRFISDIYTGDRNSSDTCFGSNLILRNRRPKDGEARAVRCLCFSCLRCYASKGRFSLKFGQIIGRRDDRLFDGQHVEPLAGTARFIFDFYQDSPHWRLKWPTAFFALAPLVIERSIDEGIVSLRRNLNFFARSDFTEWITHRCASSCANSDLRKVRLSIDAGNVSSDRSLNKGLCLIILLGPIIDPEIFPSFFRNAGNISDS